MGEATVGEDFWVRFFEARDRRLSVLEASEYASGRGAPGGRVEEPVPPVGGPPPGGLGDNTTLPQIDFVSKPPQEVPPGAGALPGPHPGGRPRARVPLPLVLEMRRRGLTLREIALHLQKRGHHTSIATLSRRLRR